MTMKNIQLTLSKDLLKRDYKWLNRDFKKGEQVYLLMERTDGCIGKNGITCGTNNIDCFFELPTTALWLKHENKVFVPIHCVVLPRGLELIYIHLI
jgi:hypothetical protein